MTNFNYSQHRDMVREVIAELLRDKHEADYDAVEIVAEKLPDEPLADLDDDEYEQFLEGLAEYIYGQVDSAKITVEWPNE